MCGIEWNYLFYLCEVAGGDAIEVLHSTPTCHFHDTRIEQSEYNKDILMLVIAVAFGNCESSFFLIMLTSSRLCIHVSNGNVRLLLIFVDLALRESFGPAVLFLSQENAQVCIYHLTFSSNFLGYKLKRSKK